MDSAAATEVECNLLYDESLEGKSYSSAETVGYASGYGKYTKGQPADVLYARSLDGYRFVGWKVQYIDDSGLIQFVDDDIDSTYMNDQADYESTYKMEYSVSLQDKNDDGINDYGTLSIDKCQVDIIVKPVYDYIYYNVLIEDFDKMSFAKTQSIGANQIYFNLDAITTDGITVYKDVIVQIGEEYRYFEELRTDGVKYFTTHNINLENGSVKSVDIKYTRGAYKLEDEVDVNIDFKNYIDVTGVQIKNNKKIFQNTQIAKFLFLRYNDAKGGDGYADLSCLRRTFGI